MWDFIKKAVGHFVGAVKTVGQFVKTHHQPLALAAKAIGDASGVPLLQNIGNTALAASGLATMKGIGNDYGVRHNQQFPPLNSWKQ